MTAVLGISGHYHDAAAALAVDGQIVCAIQEERLSRIKNDSALPLRAARACLRFAGIHPDELDCVAFYENPFLKLERVLTEMLRTFPRSIGQFPRAMTAQLGSKIWVRDLIAEGIPVARSKIVFSGHHESHAASAFFSSDFDEAAVLVADGVGEKQTTSIWLGKGESLRCIESLHFPHSLGLLYAGLTAYLGFEVNEGEYKVMGLAAFGQDQFSQEFEKLIRLSPDGSFSLDASYFGHFSDADSAFGPKLERLLGPRRHPAKVWDFASAEDRRYANIACSLQRTLERAMTALGRRALTQTGASRLCLAGGVALNAAANAVLKRSLHVPIYVHAAAGDAGGALGAALLHSFANGARRRDMKGLDLGLRASPESVPLFANALGLSAARVEHPAEEIAARIQRNEIVALVHGRFEWGPRALGHRSILANPEKFETRERLNHLIKKREAFRPFAPAVLSERMSQWFAGEPDELTACMTTTVDVLPERREHLAAVCHVDGSARVQSVSEDSPLHPVLKTLESAGFPPIVLNTSLNGPREPIVSSSEEALLFFAQYPVDAMFIEDVLIRRRR